MGQSKQPRFLCVGTHHKTGTVWLRRVLHAIKVDQNIPLMQGNRVEKLALAAPEGPQIIVSWAASFPPELRALPHARFIHMIRDPRDVLLSGMRYHRKAPLGREKFLAKPRADLDGLSYQEHLNALPDDHARWLFEMRNKHAQTVQEMLDWEYDAPNTVELRYEELITDPACTRFRDILTDFDIEGLDIDRAVQSFWDNSLFGGLADGETGRQHSLHLASGDVAQWKTQMPRALAEAYEAEFGDALRQLGYADSADWVNETEIAPQSAVA